MSYYKLGLAAPSPYADKVAIVRGVRDDWARVAKGRTAAQLWKAGSSNITVGGPMNSIVDFIMDAAHIVLLLAGLYVLVTTIL